MRRASLAAAAAFAVSAAVLIGLAGPLLLINPAFVTWLQDRHAVADVGFDGRREVVERLTGAYLGDLWTNGDFRASADGEGPFLDEREQSHMRDVSRLVRLLGTATLLAALAAIATGWMLRREQPRVGHLMIVAAGIVGGVGLVLGIVFAVAFDAAFLAFHAVLFPPGSYLFAPGSPLIRLFPESFWFDAALIAGGAIVLSACLVALVGWRLARTDPVA